MPIPMGYKYRCHHVNILQVVGIIEEKHSRIAAGLLEKRTDNNNKFALLIPLDRRIPRCDVPIKSCPKGESLQLFHC